MRSHLTAFGLGAAIAVLAGGTLALVAPGVIARHADKDGDVHVINIGDDNNGSFHVREGALNVTAEWKGDFAFAADARSLTSLDGKLTILSKEKGVERKAAFVGKRGEITTKFYIDDNEKEGAEAEKGAADLLQLFARSTSVNIDTRVSALMAAGGKDAVMKEIGELKGSQAIASYIEALAQSTSLASSDVKALAARLENLESDYAKREGVTALLGAGSLDDDALAEILRVAQSIKGDHELRLIIENLAERPISADNFRTVAALISDIDGDHEVRLAVSALLESENVDDAAAARALELASQTIEGDYERRLALEAAGERLDDQKVADATMAMISTIAGGHERRLAIESVASSLPEDSPAWTSLISLVAGIDGDHDRRLAIGSLTSDAPQTDEIRAELRKAAEAIKSEHERSLALEAID